MGVVVDAAEGVGKVVKAMGEAVAVAAVAAGVARMTRNNSLVIEVLWERWDR